MSWTNERQTVPGFYWFNGSAPAGQYRARQVMLSTTVEITTVGQTFVVWFPRWQDAFPLSDCDGRWVGPLEIPR